MVERKVSVQSLRPYILCAGFSAFSMLRELCRELFVNNLPEARMLWPLEEARGGKVNITIMSRSDCIRYCNKEHENETIIISISDPYMVYSSKPERTRKMESYPFYLWNFATPTNQEKTSTEEKPKSQT